MGWWVLKCGIGGGVVVWVPIVGAARFGLLGSGVRRNDDRFLFASAATIFMAAFGTLAVSFLPYIVPFTITIEQAAAPPSSLWFLFWGAGLIVFPLTLAYTAAVYFIFRGRVRDDAESY